MSFVVPGITHCEYCGERIDIDKGRRCNCLETNQVKCEKLTKEDKAKLIYSITGDVERFTQAITGDKLKLIDVLNKIANGELKEGTKVICNNSTFEYRKLHKDSGRNTLDLYSKNNTSLITATYLTPVLSFEVELIEPDHFTDAGEMAEHIREDTKMIEPADNTKIEELNIKLFSKYHYEYSELERGIMDNLLDMQDKLNEVIRKINKED